MVKEMTNDEGRMSKNRDVELQVYGEQGLTFRAHINGGGNWHGRWAIFEKAEVVLTPVKDLKQPKKTVKNVNGRALQG